LADRPLDVSYTIDRALDGTLEDDLAAAYRCFQDRGGRPLLWWLHELNGGWGLLAPAGDFDAEDLADPRVRAVVSISGFYQLEDPPITLQDIEAIDVPTMLMYSGVDDRSNGRDFKEQGKAIFAHLDTSKTVAKYRTALEGAVHNSLAFYCPAGYIDWFMRGSDNRAFAIDYSIVRGSFLLHNAIPATPDSAGGKYVWSKSSVEVTAIANRYMTALLNQYFKGRRSEHFLNGTAGNAEVEKCQMINGKERCRTTEFESAE
jgi:hypothetical protein